MITDPALHQRADALLGAMTLQEKAGQLTQYFYFSGWELQNEFVEAQVRAGSASSLLFVADPRETNRLQRLAVEESRLGIPILFGFDVIHGLRTIFPVPLALAASWDIELVERVQALAAREASAVGIRWTFAPMVDIARDPRWGRIVEGAGEDPYLGAQMAAAQVRGFQGGGDSIAPGHVVAGPKHYLGYGAALGGRDYDEVSLSESELRNVYLPPFAAAVAAGAGNIMTSYVGIDGVPGAASRWLLRDVLRDELGFDGFVVSDAGSVVDLVTHGFARDASAAAARAINAGLDMEMALGLRFSADGPPEPHAGAFDKLAEAVGSGAVAEATLDAAVRRILLLKLQLGLFEQPYVDEAAASVLLGAAEHAESARIAAERSAVLLHNTGILPLERAALRSIAVIGPLANQRRAIEGAWVFVPDPEATITVLEGLRRTAGDHVQIDYAPGVALPERTIPSPFAAMEMLLGGGVAQPEAEVTAEGLEQAVALAQAADVAVLVLGETADMNGECASRATLDLPGRQLELLEAVAATGTPVVLVLLSGRPLDLRRATELSAAVLMGWHPGTAGGLAIARLLFGDAVPGGKLPFSWPRSVGQVPIIYSRLTSHQPHTAAQRYWEEPSTPLFPFGFGLSYGSVEYRSIALSAEQIGLDAGLEIQVDLHNPGPRAVEEVAQVYIHQRYGRAARPVRELKAFERLTLEPGATHTLHFTLAAAARRYWSAEDHTYVLDASMFDVWVGGDSNATLHATFEVQAS